MDQINDFSTSFSSPSTSSGQKFFITFNDNSSDNNSIPKNNVQSKLTKFFSLLMNFNEFSKII